MEAHITLIQQSVRRGSDNTYHVYFAREIVHSSLLLSHLDLK